MSITQRQHNSLLRRAAFLLDAGCFSRAERFADIGRLKMDVRLMIVHERHGASHRSGMRCDLCQRLGINCAPGFKSVDEDNVFIRFGGNNG